MDRRGSWAHGFWPVRLVGPEMQEQKGFWLLHGFGPGPEMQEQEVVAGVERGSQMLV